MEQLTELLNYYSINGIPNSNYSNYETRTKSISRQSSQHSQQPVRTHHSTGSISSLSTILGTTSGSIQQQPCSSSTNIGHHSIHSLGTSVSSGIGNVTTAIGNIAVAGIGLDRIAPQSITPIIGSVAKSNITTKNSHVPLRNSKSTSSSLMTSQTNNGQFGQFESTNAQSFNREGHFLNF